MKAINADSIQGTARWIRPVQEAGRLLVDRIGSTRDIDLVTTELVREARERVSSLVAIERELEERIRLRWEETEEEVRRRVAHNEEEILRTRKRLEDELEEGRLRAERDGRTAGFRDGFARGRDEGYRLGHEEGRREGEREGQREGREEETRRVGSEMSGAVGSFVRIVAEFQEKKDTLLAEARACLLDLALEISRRVVRREVASVPSTVVRTVEKAVDLIFRRGCIVIHVHPDDVPWIEQTLESEPRWAQGFDAVEIRGSSDVARGGCRLVSGAGSVDMTIETQLQLIEAALEGADEAPELVAEVPIEQGSTSDGLPDDGTEREAVPERGTA